jgi:thiamine transporter
MLAIVLAVVMCMAIFLFTGFKLKGYKLTTRSMARIGVISGLSLALYMIKLAPFPEGGGCTLMSILPIMILAVAFGMEEALISCMVIAMAKIVIAPPFFPMQIPLDYLAGMLAIGLTPIFGIDRPWKLLSGSIFACALSAFYSTLSGVIFFGQFAPEGMNLWWYSISYNFSGFGVEAIMSILVLMTVSVRLPKLAGVKA